MAVLQQTLNLARVFCMQVLPNRFIKAGQQGSFRMGQVALGTTRLPPNDDVVRSHHFFFRCSNTAVPDTHNNPYAYDVTHRFKASHVHVRTVADAAVGWHMPLQKLCASWAVRFV